MSAPDYNLPPHMDPPFVKAWCDMEDDGYQYSDSNVAKVHLGWMMARHEEATQVTALKEALAELAMAVTTRALRGRDHVPSMRYEQTRLAKAHALLTSLSGPRL